MIYLNDSFERCCSRTVQYLTLLVKTGKTNVLGNYSYHYHNNSFSVLKTWTWTLVGSHYHAVKRSREKYWLIKQHWYALILVVIITILMTTTVINYYVFRNVVTFCLQYCCLPLRHFEHHQFMPRITDVTNWRAMTKQKSAQDIIKIQTLQL